MRLWGVELKDDEPAHFERLLGRELTPKERTWLGLANQLIGGVKESSDTQPQENTA